MKADSLCLKAEKGQVLLGIAVFFTAIILTVLAGITGPIVRFLQIGSDSGTSAQSYYAADALAEDVVYRLKNAHPYGSSDTLPTLNGANATAAVTTTINTQTINAVSTDNNLTRKVTIVLTQGAGIAFNYGTQTGNGGINLNNGAQVIGNIYSNGTISGSGSITGTAVSANSISTTLDQVNNTPLPPPYDITFATTSLKQDFAQSFQVSATAPANSISFYLKKTGSPADMTIRITPDNGGKPAASTITSATLPASLISTTYGWATTTFPTGYTLNAGTTYWLVIDTTASASKYYTIGGNTAYTSGQALVGTYGGTWQNTVPAGVDGYFQFATGGQTGSITGSLMIGSAGVGDAWSHTTTGTTIAGNNYCQTGSGNNKACNTSKGDASPQPYPVSDANIADWKTAAAAGTLIAGDKNITSPTSLGPAKITGNLILGNTLTLTGVIWVQGNITTSNNVTVKLDPSFGANGTVLLADGYVNLSNNVTFQGTGNSSSYVLLLTTSDCPTSPACSGNNAINISNNVGTVILNAQKGTVEVKNNGGANEITADKLQLDNNATITYQSGLASSVFTTGPSGGYNIASWKEVQ